MTITTIETKDGIITDVKADFNLEKVEGTLVPPKVSNTHSISIENNELNVDLLTKNATYSIEKEGKIVGRLLKRDGQIIMNVTQSVDMTVTGKLALNKLHIKSKGNIQLDSELSGNTALTIACQNLTLTQPINTTNTVDFNAQSLHVKNDLQAKKIKVKVTDACISDQQLSADKITILAKSFQQNGVCKAKEKLKVYAQDFITKDSSLTQSDNKLVFIGEQVDAKGNFKAEGLAFFSAKTINVSQQFDLPQCTSLQTTTLKLTNKAQFNLRSEGLADAASIKADKEITIDADASMSASQTNITTNQIINKGKAQFNTADLTIKYKLIGEKNASFNLEKTQVKTKRIDTKASGSFNTSNTNIQAENIGLNSKATLKNTRVQSDYFLQGATSSYQDCEITFNKQFQILPGASLDAQHVYLQGALFSSDGELSLQQKSVINSTDVVVKAKATIDNSNVNTNTLVATANSTVNLAHDAQVTANDLMRLDGENHFAEATLTSKEVFLEGQNEIKDSTITASQSLRFGQVTGDKVTINAPTLDYLQDHSFTNSSINSTLNSRQGEGSFTHSELQSQYDTVEENAKVTMNGTNHNSELLSSSGDMVLNKSKVTTDVASQNKGTLRANQSNIKAKSAVSTQDDTKMHLSQSSLSTQFGHLQGSVDANESTLQAKSLVMSGKNQYKKSKIAVEESLSLQNTHQAETSMFTAKSMFVDGQLSLKDKSRLETSEDLTTTATSILTAKESLLKAQKSMAFFGEVNAEKAQVMAENIHSYKKLKSKQSQFAASQKVVLAHGSETDLDQSLIAADNVELHSKLTANKASIEAKSDITFHSNAKTTADGLALKAEGEVTLKHQAEIDGKSVSVKASALTNYGDVNTTESLIIDADYITNDFGSMTSLGATSLTAARAFTNMYGRVGGKHTKINALGIINTGDVAGSDSLTMNSIVDFNAGLCRSYNVSKNNVIGFNAGPVLPTMPSSWEAALNPSHLLTASRIILTNVLPSKAKLIDFGFTAAPLAYKAVKKTYHFAKDAYEVATNPDKKWTELLPTVPTLEELEKKIKEARLVDCMEPLLAAKSFVTTASGLYQSASSLDASLFTMPDAEKDFKSLSWSDALDIPLTVLGSTYTSNSVLNVNAGVVAFQNSTQTDIFSANYGVDVALQSYTHNSQHMVNGGVYAANKVTVTATDMNNTGLIANHTKMTLNVNQFSNQGHGTVQAQNADFKFDTLNDNGSMVVNGGRVEVKQELNVGDSANSSYSKVAITANTLNDQGKLAISESQVDVKEAITTEKHSTLNIDNSSVTTKRMKAGNEGNVTISESKVDVTEAISTEMQSTLKIDKSDVTTKQMKVGKESTVTLDSTNLKADTLQDDGSLKATSSSVDVTNKINVGKGATFQAEKSQVTSAEFTNEGLYTAQKTLTKVTGAFTNQEDAQFKQQESELQAQSLQNQGHMELDQSSVKVTEDVTQTQTGSMTATKSSIESKTLSLDGQATTSEAYFHADEIKVKQTAHIDVEKNTTFSGKTVEFAGSASNKDTLALVAEQTLTTTATANITGETGSLYMSAKDGSVKGTVAQKNIYSEIDHLQNAQDFITGTGDAKNIKASTQLYCKIDDNLNLTSSNQRDCSVAVVANAITVSATQSVKGDYSLEATKGDIVAKADIHASRDLDLKAKNDIVNQQRKLTAGQDVSAEAGHSVINNKGTIVADRNEFIHAETGVVRNTAGTLQGKNHIEVVAKAGIINEATEQDVRTKHGTKKEYTASSIIGGKGEGFEGSGAVLVTDGKLINDASNIVANGKVGISAKEGVESTARSNRYVVDEYTKKSGFLHHKKTHVVIYDTQVAKSTIGSSDGSVMVYSEKGGIKCTATDFYSANGIALVAEKKIELYDLIGKREEVRNKSSCWGLTHENKRTRDDFSVPSSLYSRKDITVISKTDDVIMRGTKVATPGTFYAEGERVKMSVSKLEHETTVDRAGFSVAVFGQTVLTSNAPSQHANLPFTSESTYNHVKELTLSNGAAETGLNAMNTAVDAANTANAIVSGLRNDSLLQAGLEHFGVGSIDPSVTLTYTKEKETTTSQTIGEGSVTAGRVELKARNGNVELEGLPVVAGSMKVTAKSFVQKGMDLESTHTKHTTSIGIGTSSTGSPNASVKEERSKEKRHDFVNEQLRVEGNLELVVEDSWVQDGANADVGSLSGHAQTHEIITHTSTLEAKSMSAGLSTGGDFSYSQNKTSSKLITETSGVNIRGTGAAENTKFEVDTLHNVGGVITNNGGTDYAAKKVIAEDVKESVKSSGFSISGNINDFKSDSDKVVNAKDDQGRKLKTVNLGLDTVNYEAVQHATVVTANNGTFSAEDVQGQLARDLEGSKQVTRDESHHYVAEVPIFDQKTVDQMRDNAAWAGAKATGTTYQPTLPLNEAILAHEQFNSPEEVEAYAEKVRDMEALSEAAYGGDTIPDGFHAVDEGYTNDSKVIAYVNDETGEMVIAFRGTANVNNLIKDDKDIALHGEPRCFDDNTRAYIENAMKQYPGYDVVFTGHSLGGAEAALASNYYGQPAIVFDNPGIENKNNEYDFSNVTSFQGMNNIVNHAGPLTFGDLDQGNVVRLAQTSEQSVLAEASKQLGGAGELGYSTYNHKLGQVKAELDEYLTRQVNKAQNYGPSSSTFFKSSNDSTRDNNDSSAVNRPK